VSRRSFSTCAENAAATLFNEWDKIRSYQNIVAKVREAEFTFLDIGLSLPTIQEAELADRFSWEEE